MFYETSVRTLFAKSEHKMIMFLVLMVKIFTYFTSHFSDYLILTFLFFFLLLSYLIKNRIGLSFVYENNILWSPGLKFKVLLSVY